MVDLRWQLVLDRLGSEEPAFGQGTLVAFRERLVRSDMDRRLLERTSEFARQTKAFDFKKPPKTLRVAMIKKAYVPGGARYAGDSLPVRHPGPGEIAVLCPGTRVTVQNGARPCG